MSCKTCQVIIVEEAPYLESYFGVYVTQGRPPLPPSQNLILNGPRQYVTPPVAPPPNPPSPPGPVPPPEIPGPQNDDPGTPIGDPNDDAPTGPNTGGNTSNPGGPPPPPDTPNNPNNEEPEVRDFGNVPVFFNNCTAGTVMQFTGSTPQWIMFNGTSLEGRANVFRGETQDLANEAAQAELDEFAAAAIANGDLTCVAAVCPSYTGAVTGFNDACIQTAYDPVNDWLFIGGFSTQTVDKVDPATNAILASSASVGAAIRAMIYVPGPTPVDANPAILFTAGSDLYHLNPTTMAVTLLQALSSIAISSTMAYGPNLNEVIIPIGTDVNVYVMVLGFGALINIPGNTSGGSFAYNSTQQVFYSTNFDTVTYVGAHLLVIDETTLNVTGSLTFAVAADSSDGQANIAYCPSNGKIYVGTHNNSTNENKVYVVDAATLTVDTTIALDSDTDTTVPFVQYSSELGLIIVGVDKAVAANVQTVVIDPGTNTVLCTITGTRVAGGGVDVASNSSFYFNVRQVVNDNAVAQLA